MGQYLIDTNAISGYFIESFSENALNLLDIAINSGPNISVITQIEVLSWKAPEEIEAIVKGFIDDSNVIDLSHEVIAICIDLRRKYKFKTPDAIIAATALANDYELITVNEKDFQNVKGLKIVNPHKM
jgi:predicted nucleic acid-binding protein